MRAHAKMFLATCTAVLIAGGLVIALRAALTPQKVTWTFRKHSKPADFGWYPKDAYDISFGL